MQKLCLEVNLIYLYVDFFAEYNLKIRESDTYWLVTMNLSRSLVDSWYNREPFLSDVGSSSSKPTDSHIVFRNKTYPSATAALEAYIDDYLGHNTRGRRRYGRDCVADLLLMTPAGDTSSLPSVSMMSSSESQDRGGNGCSGIKIPENFATDSESSNPKNKHHHVGRSIRYLEESGNG